MTILSTYFVILAIIRKWKFNISILIMKYKIKVIETLSKVVEVEADDMNSAYEKVEEMVNCEEIILSADDFEGREFYPDGNENK